MKKTLGCFCLQSLSKLCGPDGRKRGGEMTGVGRQEWGGKGRETGVGRQGQEAKLVLASQLSSHLAHV